MNQRKTARLREVARGFEMNEEEKFAYEGVSAVESGRFRKVKKSVRVLFMEVDAVFPQLESEPLLNRIDYEIVKEAMGWDHGDGYQALNGWHRRVSESCAGYDFAYVFSYALDRRTELLRNELSMHFPGVGATFWTLRDWGYGVESDYFVETFSDCLRAIQRTEYTVCNLQVHLNRDAHFVDEVRRGLLVRDAALPVNIKSVHPQLGLFARGLPMPEEFQAIDDWLDARDPLPGEVQRLKRL